LRNKKLWIGLGAGVLLVIFVAGALLRPARGKTVQAAEVTRRTLVAEVKAPGTVEPRTVVALSAEVPGKIVRLAVQEGQAVRRGDLLLRLDDTAYRARVEQAKAELTAAGSRRRSAEAAWKAAQPLYERRKALFAQGLLSVGEMEAAENEYEKAYSEFEAARGEVVRQEAALVSAQDQLDKTVYRSPIHGVVIQRNVEEGEIVVVGTMNNPGTVILSVGDVSQMVVKAEVDETDVVEVRLDQEAHIEVDAFPDSSFPGRVVEIAKSPLSRAASSGEKDYEVEVLFERTPKGLLSGMTADVEIETGRRDSALSVPIQSVLLRSARDLEERRRGRRRRAAPADTGAAAARDLTGVFVLTGDQVEFREVTTGIASDTDIEILSGVERGDRVVTGPYNVLRDLKRGDRVKVEKEEGAGRRSR
jgi:HlyD family secretion protein